MDLTKKENVNRIMAGLSPEARHALEVMSQMKNSTPEDVLREEIKRYIAGRIPSIDIEGALSLVKQRAYQAGYIFGCIKKITNRWGRDH